METLKSNIITAWMQGGNWMVNINGYEKQLHYSIRTKADVKAWLAGEQDDHCYEGYTLKFCK